MSDMPTETLTATDLLAIRRLRNKGCAVIVWLPSELRGADLRRVEDRSIELGYEVIDCLSRICESDNAWADSDEDDL